MGLRPKLPIIICLLTLGLVMAFVPSFATLETNNSKYETYPQLFATKIVDKTEIVLGQSAVVTITLENFGNRTAYNVTIVDHVPNPWIFEVTGLTQLSYSQIPPNETRRFSYLITTKLLSDTSAEGDIIPFKLLGAQIDYYDSNVNPSKFTHTTNDVLIKVIEPPEDFSLTNRNAAITLLIILIVFNLILFIRLIAPKMDRRAT